MLDDPTVQDYDLVRGDRTVLVGVLAVKTCSSVTIVRPLLKEYKGKVNIPDDLYRTYERFVTARQKADRDAIAKMCLPNSVSITTERRPAGARNSGRH